MECNNITIIIIWDVDLFSKTDAFAVEKSLQTKPKIENKGGWSISDWSIIILTFSLVYNKWLEDAKLANWHPKTHKKLH